MLKSRLIFGSVFLFILLCSAGSNTYAYDYLGQTPPGETPEIFAPGLISSTNHEHSAPVFSPDGNEVYWSAFVGSNQYIYYSRAVQGKWSSPKVAPFSGTYSDGGPCFSPDGNRLYFYSQRPLPENGEVLYDDVWYLEKTKTGWGEPKNLGLSTMSKREKWIFSPSLSHKGNLYLTGALNGHGVFSIHQEGDHFGTPVALDPKINSNYYNFNWTPFIAPDESYLIFSSKRSDSYGFNDLYISFRRENGIWSTPQNMGSQINNGKQVRFPSVSPDGKYLFFTREGPYGFDDVFWVDAGIIGVLKKSSSEERP